VTVWSQGRGQNHLMIL